MRRRDFIGGGAAVAAALGQGTVRAGQGWLLAAEAEVQRARDRILSNFEHPAPRDFFALADAVACLGAYRCFANHSLEEQLLPEAQALIQDVARRVGRGVLCAEALMSQPCGLDVEADGLARVRACLTQDAEDPLERSMVGQLPKTPEDLAPVRRRLAKLRRLLPDLAVVGTQSGVFAGDPGLARRVRGLTGNENGGPSASGDLLLALGLLLLGGTIVGGAVVATVAICAAACGGAIAPLLLAAPGCSWL
ncbi:MAG: hypothetical protein GY884_34790, partial [Proteobacteria bacterium]|nr:hypothetical protein [Pseudomonadota bacterium]